MFTNWCIINSIWQVVIVLFCSSLTWMYQFLGPSLCILAISHSMSTPRKSLHSTRNTKASAGVNCDKDVCTVVAGICILGTLQDRLGLITAVYLYELHTCNIIIAISVIYYCDYCIIISIRCIIHLTLIDTYCIVANR